MSIRAKAFTPDVVSMRARTYVEHGRRPVQHLREPSSLHAAAAGSNIRDNYTSSTTTGKSGGLSAFLSALEIKELGWNEDVQPHHASFVPSTSSRSVLVFANSCGWSRRDHKSDGRVRVGQQRAGRSRGVSSAHRRSPSPRPAMSPYAITNEIVGPPPASAPSNTSKIRRINTRARPPVASYPSREDLGFQPARPPRQSLAPARTRKEQELATTSSATVPKLHRGRWLTANMDPICGWESAARTEGASGGPRKDLRVCTDHGNKPVRHTRRDSLYEEEGPNGENMDVPLEHNIDADKRFVRAGGKIGRRGY